MTLSASSSIGRTFGSPLAAVVLGVTVFFAPAVSVFADVRSFVEQGRRPVGPRIASSVGNGFLTTCAVNGDGTVRCWGGGGEAVSAITGVAGNVPLSGAVAISGITSAVAVAVGDAHACALRSDGGVLCWGSNSSGQLGNGTFSVQASPPQQVPNLANVVSLATGEAHTCAVVISGAVLCWGLNGSRQLGFPADPPDTFSPQEVPGLVTPVAVSAGAQHTCALSAAGEVACWGRNDNDQANPDNPDFTVLEPEDLPLSMVVDLDTGPSHTCVVLANGTLRCWGGGSFEGIEQVQDVSNAVAVAGSCALIADGSVRCFADGSTFAPGVGGALEIGAGSWGGHCALLATDTIRCWVGVGGTITSTGGVAPLSGRGIAAGSAHSCARRADGSFACWGENGSGQLGNGFPTDRSTPGTVVSAGGARIVGSVLAAGGDHSCSRTNLNGGARCWGANGSGQTGDTDRTGVRPAPVIVIDQGTTSLTNIVAITNGTSHSCALLASGRAKCWGSNSDGQLGDGTTNTPAFPLNSVFVRRTPTQILENIKAITAGSRHTCALIADGSVRCWGANETGQVTGTAGIDVLTAVQVIVPGSVAIGAGDRHTCSVSLAGTVTCWGLNSSDQLGSRSAGGGFGVTNAMAVGVAAGDAHTCAVRGNGTIQCWGANNSGQLGNDTFTPSVNPVFVKERRLFSCPIPPGLCSGAFVLTQMVSLEAGAAHTCAVRGDGQPFCWGADDSGQVGNGTPNQDQSSAKLVPSFR